MPAHPKGSVAGEVRAAIEQKLSGAKVEVTGGGGHYTIVVVSALFAGKSSLERQRLVYGAIGELMRGDEAPVHAIDSLTTRVE